MSKPRDPLMSTIDALAKSIGIGIGTVREGSPIARISAPRPAGCRGPRGGSSRASRRSRRSMTRSASAMRAPRKPPHSPAATRSVEGAGVEPVGDDHGRRDRDGQGAAVETGGHRWQLTTGARRCRPSQRVVEGEGHDGAVDHRVSRRRSGAGGSRDARRAMSAACPGGGGVRFRRDGERGRPTVDGAVARQPGEGTDVRGLTGTAANCVGWNRLRKSWAPPLTTRTMLARRRTRRRPSPPPHVPSGPSRRRRVARVPSRRGRCRGGCRRGAETQARSVDVDIRPATRTSLPRW